MGGWCSGRRGYNLLSIPSEATVVPTRLFLMVTKTPRGLYVFEEVSEGTPV